MGKRFVSIWFRYLLTDWHTQREPSLGDKPLILSMPAHGRMVVMATNRMAELQGIHVGMAVADARAIIPGTEVLESDLATGCKILRRFARSCSRFTPIVAMDEPDGLLLDVTGCAHLWGGELSYITDIRNRILNTGYTIQVAIADTIGCAWALARYGRGLETVERNQQLETLMKLPPAALRLEQMAVDKLKKLGLRQVKDFVSMPPGALRRRFGDHLITRLHQALGIQSESLEPIEPIVTYQERLPCIEPIITGAGIEIALRTLLSTLCNRLAEEEKGVRQLQFRCHRIDDEIQELLIGTTRATHHVEHLFRLFEDKLNTITPGAGIELFVLVAVKVEPLSAAQHQLWSTATGLHDHRLTELLDRIAGKLGAGNIARYLPDEHHWPERSYTIADSIAETRVLSWPKNLARPLRLLANPEPIEVAAPIPDYPPMLFRYLGQVHRVKKADGPERIEREWWLEEGEHRDYYYVEDEAGGRYWIFRSGHYSEEQKSQWFIYGFFS